MNGFPLLPDAEWLETDGLGGYALSTVSGRNARRYHGLLVSATTPPSTRWRCNWVAAYPPILLHVLDWRRRRAITR